MNTELITKAQSFLAKVNDTSLDMATRIEAYREANAARSEAHVGWSKIGSIAEDIAAEIEKATDAAKSIKVPARKTAKSAAPAKEPEVKKPLKPGRLHLRNKVQLALYTEAFIPELGETTSLMEGEAGKWSKTRPEGHAEPWLIAKVSVSKTPKDDASLGKDFDAPKSNYNLNDSNWTNHPSVTPKLLAIAQAIDPKMTKKAVVAELLDMKNIFQMRLPAKDAAPAEPAKEQETEAA